jgi:hypothetical protein
MHQVIVYVIANKDDAPHGVAGLAHFPLYLPACVNQTAQNSSVDDIDPLRAPAPVEVVEQHPHGIFPLQVVRYQSTQLLDVVSVDEFGDLICGQAPAFLPPVLLLVLRADAMRQGS